MTFQYVLCCLSTFNRFQNSEAISYSENNKILSLIYYKQQHNIIFSHTIFKWLWLNLYLWCFWTPRPADTSINLKIRSYLSLLLAAIYLKKINETSESTQELAINPENITELKKLFFDAQQLSPSPLLTFLGFNSTSHRFKWLRENMLYNGLISSTLLLMHLAGTTFHSP